MRSLIMAAAADISCFTAGVSAEPLIVIPNPMVQQADFYCGPQCQKHRDVEHQRVRTTRAMAGEPSLSSPQLHRVLSRLLIAGAGSLPAQTVCSLDPVDVKCSIGRNEVSRTLVLGPCLMHHLRRHIGEGTRGQFRSRIAVIMFHHKRSLQDRDALVRGVPVPWDVGILIGANDQVSRLGYGVGVQDRDFASTFQRLPLDVFELDSFR